MISCTLFAIRASLACWESSPFAGSVLILSEICFNSSWVSFCASSVFLSAFSPYLIISTAFSGVSMSADCTSLACLISDLSQAAKVSTVRGTAPWKFPPFLIKWFTILLTIVSIENPSAWAIRIARSIWSPLLVPLPSRWFLTPSKFVSVNNIEICFSGGIFCPSFSIKSTKTLKLPKSDFWIPFFCSSLRCFFHSFLVYASNLSLR